MQHSSGGPDRRTFLRRTSVCLLGVGLAGCTGPGEDGGEGGEEEGGGGGEEGGEEDEGELRR